MKQKQKNNYEYNITQKNSAPEYIKWWLVLSLLWSTVNLAHKILKLLVHTIVSQVLMKVNMNLNLFPLLINVRKKKTNWNHA